MAEEGGTRESGDWQACLVAARKVKEDVERERVVLRDGTDPDEGDDALRLPPTMDTGYLDATYDEVAAQIDADYSAFRAPPREVTRTCDVAEKLDQWIRSSSLQALATRLHSVPWGLASSFSLSSSSSSGRDEDDFFVFTPWQRLSVAYWTSFPFDVSSRHRVGEDEISRLASSPVSGRKVRRKVVDVRVSVRAGSFPDVGLVDLPTGTGKTAWTTSVACVALSSSRFPSLVEEYRTKKTAGTAYVGCPLLPVARLAVFFVPPASFDQFEVAVRRALPVLRASDPTIVPHAWTTVGKRCCVEVAARSPPDHAFFWVVPTARANEVMRQASDVAIAFCAWDGYCASNSLSERDNVPVSPVLKTVLAQGTPQDLVGATQTGNGWLRRTLGCGDVLRPPAFIDSLIKIREFNAAQTACQQASTLDVSSLTVFRAPVRQDLRHMVPSSLRVTYVRSVRVTLSSHLLHSESDIVPSSFPNALMYCLHPLFGASKETIRALRLRVDGVVHSFPALKACLLDLFPQEKEEREERDRSSSRPRFVSASATLASSRGRHEARASVERVVRRMTEFVAACPVCLQAPSFSEVRIYGCCGYCVCASCYDATHADPGRRIGAGGRCPFCREETRDHFERSKVGATPPSSPSKVPWWSKNYPSAEEIGPYHHHISPSSNVLALMAEATRRNDRRPARQITNLVACMHLLAAAGVRRLFLVVDALRSRNDESLSRLLCLDAIGSTTGFEMLASCDMNLSSGKGKAFASAKAKYDARHRREDRPMCLVVSASYVSTLSAANLDLVDALVTVGNVPDSALTRSLGRVFRPRPSRDNSKPFDVIKIHAVEQ